MVGSGFQRQSRLQRLEQFGHIQRDWRPRYVSAYSTIGAPHEP